jgi:uridine kinase
MREHYKKHVSIPGDPGLGKGAHVLIARAVRRRFKRRKRCVVIAVGGPGGTGKTTFSGKLARELGDSSIFALDDYKTSRKSRQMRKIFGPHPEANEMDLLAAHLAEIKRGNYIEKPVYCRQRGRAHGSVLFSPAKFVIAEGEISTYREFHKYVDFSIFIDSHWKTQLNARIMRDIEKRGYTPQKAIAAFLYSNLHEFPEYGAESKNWADVHIHCAEDHSLAIDAVCSESLKFMIGDVSSGLASVLLAGYNGENVTS